ncbi:MAG: methionine adenosyltransferase domain-containing protein, partial [Bacteroidales bacterium]|nr:methionine adenosyltransferase domain-containing protein [Bacteroidales bacterium]
IAKNLVAAGVADELLVQVSYAIGVARPVSIYVNTYGTAHVALSDGAIAEKINGLFGLRPAAIVEKFGLTNPIYEPTAAYGHMGRDPYVQEVEMIRGGEIVRRKVQFFGWELLDAVDRCRTAFQL